MPELAAPGGRKLTVAQRQAEIMLALNRDSTDTSYKSTDTRICTIQEHCLGQKSHQLRLSSPGQRKQMECVQFMFW